MPVDQKAGLGDENRNTKVCLIVKDNRDPNVVATQMCGIMRNGFGAALGIIALRNQETLDVILAHGLSDRLRYAGYEVVAANPTPPAQLSTEYREKMKGMKDQVKAARQSQEKTERRQAIEMRDAETPLSARPLVFERKPGRIEAPSGSGGFNGADVAIQIEINDFTSDPLIHAFTIEILGWSKLTMTVAPVSRAGSGPVAVAELAALGRYKAPGAARASWKSVLNSMHKDILDGFEAAIRSEEFQRAIAPNE